MNSMPKKDDTAVAIARKNEDTFVKNSAILIALPFFVYL